jgi:hypothetical protein
MRSSDGSSVEIHHNDGLQNDDLESDPEAKQAAAEASSNDTVQQDPAPELKLGKRPIRKWSKRWWRRKFADLWYIIRKEHVLVGIMVPLHEELAVLTRFQSLLCFYTEIQLSLAVAGLFLGTSQTATNAGLVAFLSIMVVSPASLLLPYMFTSSQKIVSTSVRISHENRTKTDPKPIKRSSSVGIHTIVSRHTHELRKSVTPVVPFTLPKDDAQDDRQSWTTLLGGRGTSNNKVTPAHAAARDQAKISPPNKMSLFSAFSAGKRSKVSPVKQLKGRYPSALAAKMLRKKRKELEV